MILRNKDGREERLQIQCDQLAWFETSPNAGDPDCICSYCSFVILEGEIPIRLFHQCKRSECELENKEARLHQACFKLLVIKE